jgi:predicted nucleic acid-binding protein
VIESLAGFPVRVEDLERFRAAPAPQRRRQCSFRDAKILAAASAPGCDVVYSEDLKSARDHRGVKGVNPLPR